MEQHFLSKLPYELLLYVLKQYLDLADLWNLMKVSKHLRIVTAQVIKKQWKIEVDCKTSTNTAAASLLKIQTHAAMIALGSMSRKLIQRIKIYDPYAFPPSLAPRQQQDESEESEESEDDENRINNNRHGGFELDILNRRGPIAFTFGRNMITTRQLPSPSSSFTTSMFPPTIEPGLDDIGNENGFFTKRLKYHAKRLHDILQLETKLHARIGNGIHAHVHGDKLQHTLRSVMDVMFHHVVFVNAMSRRPYCYHYGKSRGLVCRDPPFIERKRKAARLACTTADPGLTRVFAAATSRFFCELMNRFPYNSDRIIPTLVAENINTFLTYTGYRLLAAAKKADTDFFTSINSTNKQYHCWSLLLTHCGAKEKEGRHLLMILHSISSCMDLLGACYKGNVLKDKQALPLVRKVVSLLGGAGLLAVKKSILVDLVDVWLGVGRLSNTSSPLEQLVQEEINKCG